MPSSQGATRVDRFAPEHHVEGHLGAHQSRQPLGAAGTGEQREFDLREPDRGVLGSTPVVAGQGQFQSAAQSRAMQRRDYGLGQRLDTQQHVIEQRGARRRVEFPEIRAGYKKSPDPVNDQASHRRVGFRRRYGGQQGGPHRLRERVDRRVFDSKGGDSLVNRIGHRGSHGGWPLAKRALCPVRCLGRRQCTWRKGHADLRFAPADTSP